MRFGDVVALDGLDLRAEPAEITAVLGPNGSGKTTFVRSLATLQRYDGQLQVAGRDVAEHAAWVRARLGLAGQHAAIVAKLTGRENLDLAARLCGLGRGDRRRAVDDVIDSLSLRGFVDQPAETLSGGQRRRVDIAVALVSRPSLVLLDEPTTGVDPRSRSELWDLVRSLPDRGVTILLTTQHLDEANALADRVVIIDQGRSVAAGTPDELRARLGTTTLRITSLKGIDVAAAAQIADALDAEHRRRANTLTLVGRFDLAAAHRAVCDAAVDGDLSEFALEPPGLDDVFLAATSTDVSR